MNDINRHNYEAFYLDYLEGNLDEESVAQLLSFLDKNPALKLELEDFESVKLTPDIRIDVNKEALKQVIDKHNVEEYIIAALENEIEKDDALALKNYLNQSAEAQVLAARYKKTILEEEKTIFPNKNSLKKKTQISYYIFPLISTAAAILIFFFIYIPSTQKSDTLSGLQQKENHKTDSLLLKLSLPDHIVVIHHHDSLDNILKTDKEQHTITKVKKAAIEKLKIPQQQLVIHKKKKNTIKPAIENNNESRENVALLKNDQILDTLNIKETEQLVRELNDDMIKHPLLDTKTHKETKATEIESVIDTAESISKQEVLIASISEAIETEVPVDREKTAGKPKASEILAAVVNKIDKVTKTDIAYNYDKGENSTTYGFSIGKFGFSRTKRR